MSLQPANFEYATSGWKPLVAKLSQLKDDTPRELGYGGRGFQKRCYKKLHSKSKTILIAPTGSGKSLMQVFNAAREIIESDYKQKQVFVVPQLNIGKGFSEHRHRRLRIGRKVYFWEITKNCCPSVGNYKESVKTIKDFLLTTPCCKEKRASKVLGGCTALVTSAALVAAFRQMNPKERLRAVQNVSFRLDESHHIAGVIDGIDETNRLGEFCKFVCDNDGSLHLTTATHFRSNQQVILSNAYLEDFEIFRVPFLEHWATLGLRSLQQSYHRYKNSADLSNQILRAAAEEPDQPLLIIVPSDGMKFFKRTNKWKWVAKLVNGLNKIFGSDNVLDLVSLDRQQKDKEKLICDDQNFSAVVTCMIGREGADWPACSRIHNTILDANVLQPIQKLGRALRQHDDKVDVKMFNYIKHLGSWDDSSESIREKLSDYFNTVIAVSMLDDMFYPILMPTIPESEISGKSRGVTLEDVYGGERNELIDDMIRQVMSIPISGRTPEAIAEIIDGLIREYADDQLEEVSHDDLRDRLRKELLRRMSPEDSKLKIDRIIVDFIRKNGWDKVVKDHIAPNSPFSATVKTKDLEELQKFLDGDWMEMWRQVQKIGIKNVEKEKDNPLHRFLKRVRREYIQHKATE